MPESTERVGRAIIGAAIAVHRALGPGLLESAYKLEAGYRVDLMADGVGVAEVKSVDALAPVHEAQLLTYLRLSGRRLGFLINFNVVLLKQGVKRMIL